MRVLAADDDEALARVLDRHLRAWGYEATIAHSGIEAWRILKHDDAPRIVILDWDMPGLSGLEVCRLLRSTPQGASAYVLMLTGRVEKDDVVQALESGADDFLSKPFHPRELQLRLAKGVRDSVREGGAGGHLDNVAPLSGTILGGKYRLEKKIGEGGMGSVWLGVHLSLGINVAIKFMAKSLAETPDYQSFEREAHAAAQLRNLHVVRVYDHGIAFDGQPYLVMEYLAGDSLTTWVERQGPLSGSGVASLVEQTAAALTEAHERGLVHRDVKPDNILMIEDGDQAEGFVVKLIDFGLAKPWLVEPTYAIPGYLDAAAESPSSESPRAPSFVAGTPLYMSPECFSSSAPPTPLLDLWGLAVTAFFAVTGGSLPFEGENLGELYRQICVEPLPVASEVLPGVPVGFDAWFSRACARDPEARFQTAGQLGAMLSAACKSHDVAPRSTPGTAKGRGSFAPTEPHSDIALTGVQRKRNR
jgi:serine/threonine protein kinase/ActR/RegA family two-component response regulator